MAKRVAIFSMNAKRSGWHKAPGRIVIRKRSCGCCLSLSAELRGELEQRLVVAAGSGQLHAAAAQGMADDRHAGKAEGRGVAQQADAGLAVVGAGGETRDGSAGKQQQLVFGEQLIHAGVEFGVALAQARRSQ